MDEMSIALRLERILTAIESIKEADTRKRNIHSDAKSSEFQRMEASRFAYLIEREFWMQWENVEAALYFLINNWTDVNDTKVICSCEYGRCWTHSQK